MLGSLVQRRADLITQVAEIDRRLQINLERALYAKLAAGLGAIIFVGNIMGSTGPTNGTLGTFALIALLGGCFWIWSNRQQSHRDYGSRNTAQAALAEVERRIEAEKTNAG